MSCQDCKHWDFLQVCPGDPRPRHVVGNCKRPDGPISTELRPISRMTYDLADFCVVEERHESSERYYALSRKVHRDNAELNRQYPHTTEGTMDNELYAAVICKIHGTQGLTKAEYDVTQKRDRRVYMCPICGAHSEWSETVWTKLEADRAVEQANYELQKRLGPKGSKEPVGG